MRRLFADTFYWIALLNRRDRWNRRVVEVTASLGTHHLFTTDAVSDHFRDASALLGRLRDRLLGLEGPTDPATKHQIKTFQL